MYTDQPPERHDVDKSLFKISGILLAAGESRRMGKPKLLLPWNEKTLIEHVVETYLRSNISELVVVTGPEKDAVQNLLSNYQVLVVNNQHYKQGMGISLQCGLEATEVGTDAFLIALADQPLLTADIINLLIQRHLDGEFLITVPVFRGNLGHPVIFSKELRQELMALEGDQGGKSIVEKYLHRANLVRINTDAVLIDIDTPEDYAHTRLL